MSIRWRLNGDLVCAAVTEAEKDDTYIDDRLHHQLHSVSGAIIADVNHEENGLWHWVHSENKEGEIYTGLRAVNELAYLRANNKL